MLSEMLSFLLLVSLTAQAFSARTDPRQIHISSTGESIISYIIIQSILKFSVLAGEGANVVVTWITFDSTDTSQVKYAVHGSATLNNTAVGVMTNYTNDKIIRYVHRVSLQDLQPHTQYGEMHALACRYLCSIAV